MTEKTESYEQAVDYELISEDTGRRIPIPRAPLPRGCIAVPRWCFISLLGLSALGALSSVLLAIAFFAAFG